MQSTSNALSLLSFFDRWTLEKGKDYFKRGKVANVSVGNQEISGIVRGSSNYHVNIRYRQASIISASCTCPMRKDCKHAAALVFAYQAGIDRENFSQKNRSNPALQLKSVPVIPVLGVTAREPSASPENAVAVQPMRDGQPPVQALPHAQSGGKPASVNSESAPSEILNSFRCMQNARNASELDHSRSQSNEKTFIAYILKDNLRNPEPVIEIKTVTMQKNGKPSAGRKTDLDEVLRNGVSSSISKSDLEIAKLWRALSRSSGDVYHYYSRHDDINCDSELFEILLTRILKTNRCFFESTNNAPLSIGPKISGKLSWTEMPNMQFALQVCPEVSIPSVQCLQWNAPWYVDRSSRLCGPVSMVGSNSVVEAAMKMRALRAEELDYLPKLMAKYDLEGEIDAPPKVTVRHIKSRPSVTVGVIKLGYYVGGDKGIIASPNDQLKALLVTNQTNFKQTKVSKSDENTLVIEKQDFLTQAEVSRTIEKMGLQEVDWTAVQGAEPSVKYFVASDPCEWFTFSQSHLAQIENDGWAIDDHARSLIAPLELDDSDLEFGVSQESDWWFSLALNISIDGKTTSLLPILTSAIQRLPNGIGISAESIDKLNKGGRFIANLPDGKLITLPFERVRAILVALQELLTPSDSVRASILHAYDLLSDSTLSKIHWVGAERIRSFVERLRKLGEHTSVLPPKRFNAELRPYQKEGLSWLQLIAAQEFGGILADDMGLGKTVQLLAHICLEKQNKKLKNPFLVLCPTSVLPNWISECRKFAPGLKVLALYGQSRFDMFKQIHKYDLVITTYPLLVRDQDTLTAFEWHGVALDEAQAIKNPKTQIAQAARKLKTKQKFCVSGTPVENHLGELWSQFQFLMPGLLGDLPTFNASIRTPIEKEQNGSIRTALAARIRPFLLRRTKSQVCLELPDKTEIVRSIKLEGNQRDLYETVRLASTQRVRDEIDKKGFKQSQIMILDALLKLRQTCCDPRLVKLTAASKVGESAKLDALTDMLEELVPEGRKILIFSQFTSMLDLISERLNRCRIDHVQLRGDTKDRATPVESFQNGKVPVFLISLRAGGTGLNLTAADTVIHYDPWWNPAVEQQATDRAHRIGQTKKVFVYKLITEGTIEHRMLQLQDRKRSLAESIYDADGNFNRSFSESDLAMLLRPIDELS